MGKTYLKDLKPDEVIRRLLAGEVLREDDSKIKIKLVEGMICTYFSNGSVLINDSVLFDDNNKEDFYFETTDELKLEVGKCYKTRDGRKAFVCYYNKEDNEYHGCILGSDTVVCWCENGLWYENEENGPDLISEWRDDEEKESLINLLEQLSNSFKVLEDVYPQTSLFVYDKIKRIKNALNGDKEELK